MIPLLSCPIVNEAALVSKRTGIEEALRELAPRIPDFEAGVIVDHALNSHGLCNASAQTAAWLSMVAFVRHALTEYDALLEEGYCQESARHFVAPEMEAVLREWGVQRPLTTHD